MIGFSTIKQRAKNALGANYWLLVGLLLLAGVLGATAGSTGLSFSFSSSGDESKYSEELNAFITTAAIAGGCCGLLYTVFAGNVAKVGSSRICLSAYRGESFGIADLFHGFRDGRYWRSVGAMALSTLFIVLGCMAFIIPGIIIAMGLFPLPYILAENDEVSGMDAIRMAWAVSKGRKGSIFFFELSFLGWAILNALTLGVLGVFYLTPYMEVSLAGYYSEMTSPEVLEASAL